MHTQRILKKSILTHAQVSWVNQLFIFMIPKKDAARCIKTETERERKRERIKNAMNLKEQHLQKKKDKET